MIINIKKRKINKFIIFLRKMKNKKIRGLKRKSKKMVDNIIKIISSYFNNLSTEDKYWHIHLLRKFRKE